MPRRDFTRFVHQCRDGRWAVGEWVESAAQYQCPLDAEARKLTGCHTEFAKIPDGLSNRYADRARALRRARYLFGAETEPPEFEWA